MTKIITLFLCLFFSCLSAQVGIGTDTPNADAALDLTSTAKGVLITRIGLNATTDAAPLSSHVAGMIVYNTASAGSGNSAVEPGFYYNNGVLWLRLEPSPIAIGDIKHSLLANDHHGWYKLDGRAKASLPATAQTNATMIGFGALIPDATNKFLKGKSISESLMTTAGNAAIVLNQANLPNVNFTGSLSASGDHSHGYSDRYHGVPENLNLVTGLLGILSGVVLNILNNDVGSDVVSSRTSTSSSAGAHSHTGTISTGGSSEALAKPAHLVTNTFVYLGK